MLASSAEDTARSLVQDGLLVLAQLACLVVVGCLVFIALQSIADKDLKDWLVSFGVAAVGGAIVGVLAFAVGVSLQNALIAAGVVSGGLFLLFMIGR